MALSFYQFVFMHLLFTLLCSHYILLTSCSSSTQPLCHENERFALLQFKNSLSINKDASDDPSAYPKADSWGIQENNSSDDCCLWDGIECDEDSGHVIVLDLSSSLLYGSINSNSSLFSLAHLQMLNLADNHFNHSEIPSAIGHLSGLTSLNLSLSVFSGQIPSEILYLSKLASLDLSGNMDPSTSESLLKLEKPSLSKLVQKLTGLKELSLSKVNISSRVPHILSNLSSLISLFLKDCGLYGEFPIGIFHLPKLQALSVRFNRNLTCSLLEFNPSSPLEDLRLAGTSFSGKLPDSIGNLTSLFWLDLSDCVFTGSIPSSLGNLNKLVMLSLSHNQFTGQIPSSFSNFTRLTELYLSANHLSGEIPFRLGNMSQLTHLDLGDNHFHGLIPQSIFTLSKLRTLNLYDNYLSGTVEINMFLRLKDLGVLQLSNNELSVINRCCDNVTSLPKFTILALESCNLYEFPEFLQYQDELEGLFLENNKIHSHIPKWICNMGRKTLVHFSLQFNFLTGFEQLPVVFTWESLRTLDLSNNFLQGSVPIPPFSIFFYLVSNNSLSGEIPQLICNVRFLQFLDLSINSLSGKIPQCFSRFSGSLAVLNLRNNNFHGTIPLACNKKSRLRVIDLNQNQFDGPLPRSLANCTMLEFLDLGNNQIKDIFPFWLGTLSKLKILLLSSNQFHGTIIGHFSNLDFPKLCIIDLSYNSFTGGLPSKYVQSWNTEKIHEGGQSIYFETINNFQAPEYEFSQTFSFSMTMRNKGLETFYSKILKIFVAIDFSSNKFNGEIPESIGNVKGLQLLNLSNNGFTGIMPSSLGNLTNLQALDVSQNKLSGEIPQQLVQLTFLAFFNVSHNHLIGAIPRGNQFNTFENNAFDGNPELCGGPLSKKCGSFEVLPPPPIALENGNSNFPSKFDWIFICMGYGSGLVVGFVIGHILTTRKHEWFVETFVRRQQKRRKNKRAQRG